MDGIFVIKRIVPGSPPVELVLADGTLDGPLCVQGPNIQGEHSLDPTLHLDAPKPVIYDRKGGTMAVTFTIAQQHPSIVRAFHHACRHFQRVRGVATLRIELTLAGRIYVWTGTGSGWKSAEVPAPDGVSTWTRYTVLVPELTCPQFADDGTPTVPSADSDMVTADSDEITADSE